MATLDNVAQLGDKYWNRFLVIYPARQYRVHILLSGMLFLYTTLLLANPMEQGMRAYQRGERETALEHWLPLAEDGDPEAQFLVSLLHLEGVQGQGADDSAMALEWLIRSAAKGFAPAQFNLGNQYLQGAGVAQSYQQAARWFEPAAQQGFLGAQFNLANLYMAGKGVERDVEKARFWYARAAEKGSQPAQDALRQLDAKTSAEAPEDASLPASPGQWDAPPGGCWPGDCSPGSQQDSRWGVRPGKPESESGTPPSHSGPA
ncbi:MAG: hypothetical protein B0D88_04800, partial [Candidatus Sedimenticola endophacoides]